MVDGGRPESDADRPGATPPRRPLTAFNEKPPPPKDKTKPGKLPASASSSKWKAKFDDAESKRQKLKSQLDILTETLISIQNELLDQRELTTGLKMTVSEQQELIENLHGQVSPAVSDSNGSLSTGSTSSNEHQAGPDMELADQDLDDLPPHTVAPPPDYPNRLMRPRHGKPTSQVDRQEREEREEREERVEQNKENQLEQDGQRPDCAGQPDREQAQAQEDVEQEDVQHMQHMQELQRQQMLQYAQRADAQRAQHPQNEQQPSCIEGVCGLEEVVHQPPAGLADRSQPPLEEEEEEEDDEAYALSEIGWGSEQHCPATDEHEQDAGIPQEGWAPEGPEALHADEGTVGSAQGGGWQHAGGGDECGQNLLDSPVEGEDDNHPLWRRVQAMGVHELSIEALLEKLEETSDDNANLTTSVDTLTAQNQAMTVKHLFRDLDTDHDGMITLEQAVESAAIEIPAFFLRKVFGGWAQEIQCGRAGCMSESDFLYFHNWYHNTSDNSQAIAYWFRCFDIDGDGLICANDMYVVFREIVAETAPVDGGLDATQPPLDEPKFANYLTRIMDLVRPRREHQITLRELKDSAGQGSEFIQMALFPNSSKY